jgi:hypothetical protein
MSTRVPHLIAMAGLTAALCQCSLLFDVGALDGTNEGGSKSYDATDGRPHLDGTGDQGDTGWGDESEGSASGDDGPSNDSDDDKDDGGAIAGDSSEASARPDAPNDSPNGDAGDANDVEAATCASGWLDLRMLGAYASSTADGNPPMNAIDGNFSTRWESAPMLDPQYIYIDFGPGTQAVIERVQIIWGGITCARNYELQVSDDGRTWTRIWTLPFPNTVGTPNPPTGSNPWAYAVDSLGFPATSAEFLRVYTTASCGLDGYSIWEMRAYGHRLPCR